MENNKGNTKPDQSNNDKEVQTTKKIDDMRRNLLVMRKPTHIVLPSLSDYSPNVYLL